VNRLQSKFMAHHFYLAFTLIAAASLCSASPRGTAPRASADRYPVNAQHEGVSIGAKFVTAEEARKNFVSDVNACCLVVEVALYPQKDTPLNVDASDFTLSIVDTDIAAKPESAKLVAASLQKKNDSPRNVGVASSVGVGYESGTYVDPNGQTQRVHGVTTSVGVAVATGPNATGPGSTDRDTMETELTEKGLPEGTVSAPVSGYLYFAITKKKKDAKLLLEYALNGNKIALPLP
jgi:hypothetical protein